MTASLRRRFKIIILTTLCTYPLYIDMNSSFRTHNRIVCLTIRRGHYAKNILKSLCQRRSTPPDLLDVVQRRLKFNFVLGVYGRRCENRNIVAIIDVETPAIKWITSIFF